VPVELIRWIRYIATGVPPGLVVVVGADYPPGYWRHHPVAIALVAAFAGALAIDATLAHYRLNRGADVARRIEDILKGVLVQVRHATDIDVEVLAVRTYVVRRKLPRPWQGALQLVTSADLHVGPPPHSNVRWVKGKGVMGWCWEEADAGNALTVDVRGLAALARRVPPQEWAALSARQTLGLTQAEADGMGSLGVVVAYPIRERPSGQFRGCLVVEGPSGSQSVMGSKNVEEILATASMGVWATLHMASS
jgi:hypothetical protein